jgi:hypothetical protein
MSTTINNISISISVIFTEITKFLRSLCKIMLEYPGTDSVIICIYVATAIVVFVSFMKIVDILDTEADFERRRRRTPLNLVYTYIIRTSGGTSVPFLVDLNDPTGLRMQAIYAERQLKQFGVV